MVLTLSYIYELLFYRIRNRIMDTINNIFSKGKLLQESGVIPKIRYNREHLLKKETAERLNTYLNFGIFPTFTDTADPGDKQNPEQKIGTPGVRSIFNRAGAVILGSSNGGYAVDITNGDEANTHWWRIANNVPLMDSPKARQRIRKSSGCSIKELVDFKVIQCKIFNNQLIIEILNKKNFINYFAGVDVGVLDEVTIEVAGG